ncbi:ABC transporter ATP-binding protein [Pseudonocardia kujensis]|uniref:ABC transporter ATP-binding protein n=1 Tax=Pseudonocardia kujensis TaxID=1128675 RepID=UPI001E380C63|nr:ABC transporter ATP-binding protein [Pseudonocardia kujensis]MCE0762062.1 ABC transporter ATP-binding protein [Pseudonocardia kujensis]
MLPETVASDRATRADEQAGHPVLAARDVVKSYLARGGESVVLDHVDLDVADGDFLTIVGPSGCGKTTMLQLLAGLSPVTSGSVRFAGTVVESPPPGVVYVFQQFAKSIFPWRTVLDNVVFGLERDRGIDRRRRTEIGREMLGRVGLEAYERHYPGQLSGGMQQRLAIARALATSPRVLLMDEPFSALDALTRAKLQKLVLDLWRSLGITVVFVTHDIEEALLLSTRVVALRKSPATVDIDLRVDFAHPRNPVTLGEDPRFLAMRRQLLDSIYRQEGLSYEDGAR